MTSFHDQPLALIGKCNGGAWGRCAVIRPRPVPGGGGAVTVARLEIALCDWRRSVIAHGRRIAVLRLSKDLASFFIVVLIDLEEQGQSHRLLGRFDGLALHHTFR